MQSKSKKKKKNSARSQVNMCTSSITNHFVFKYRRKDSYWNFSISINSIPAIGLHINKPNCIQKLSTIIYDQFSSCKTEITPIKLTSNRQCFGERGHQKQHEKQPNYWCTDNYMCVKGNLRSHILSALSLVCEKKNIMFS